MAEKTSGQVQSLSRALGILNLLAEHEGGLTLTAVTKGVALAPSTVHRLLTTLQHERFVRFNDARGTWQIGVQAFTVGSHFLRSRDLVATARPFMEELMQRSNETTNLAMSDDGEIVYLAQVESQQLMRALTKPGARVAMHCSGVGKALLSQMQEREVARILKYRGLPRLTDHTLTTMDALMQDLNRTRPEGYAIDDEEHELGLRCIGAPVFDENGKAMAAVSLSGPKLRITETRIAELAGMVVEISQKITKAYGGAAK